MRPDEDRGRELFAACVRCHGAQGAGETSGSTPRIAGQHHRVLVRQIMDFRKGQRWDFRMEGVAAAHDKIWQLQDVADVAWYLGRQPWGGATGFGDGEHVEPGGQLYAARCAHCHGTRAALILEGRRQPPGGFRARGTTGDGRVRMTWETPAFVEIKMDAEISSYQGEDDRSE